MSTQPTTHREQPKIEARAIVRFVVFMLLYPLIVFLSAGTLNWPLGWAYIGLLVVGTLVSRLIVLRIHPDLAEERGSMGSKAGAKNWDKWLSWLVAMVGPVFQLVLAGLDHRFGWSSVPLWLQIAALGALLLAFVISTWAMAVNRFFSAVVRIQTDRGHRVVDKGPYAVVRHPTYAIGLLVQPGTALALGSLWALIPAAITMVLLAVRTALEDRTLRNELPGYEAYTQRTRYRLFPGLW